MRALAVYLKKKLGIKSSIDAIISAIRRYEEEESFAKVRETATKAVEGAKLSSKNQIAAIRLLKNDEVENTIPEIFSEKTGIHHGMVRVVRAQHAMKIYLDEEFLEKIIPLFNKKYVENIERNLGEVTVDLHTINWRIPGILNVFATELALNNISIHEVITCIPEIILFFEESDLMQAYEILHRLTKTKG